MIATREHAPNVSQVFDAELKLVLSFLFFPWIFSPVDNSLAFSQTISMPQVGEGTDFQSAPAILLVFSLLLSKQLFDWQQVCLELN